MLNHKLTIVSLLCFSSGVAIAGPAASGQVTLSGSIDSNGGTFHGQAFMITLDYLAGGADQAPGVEFGSFDNVLSYVNISFAGITLEESTTSNVITSVSDTSDFLFWDLSASNFDSINGAEVGDTFTNFMGTASDLTGSAVLTDRYEEGFENIAAFSDFDVSLQFNNSEVMRFDVTGAVHSVPTPCALALISFGGLAATRRRRS